MNSSRNFLAGLILVGFSFSCAETQSISGTLGTYYASNGILWPSSTIPVCWDNPSPASEEYESTVRDIVISEYARAGLSIIGWKPCENEEPGIHMQWSDDWPRSLIGYSGLNGKVGGFKLAYDFRSNEAKVLAQNCHASPQSLKDCIELVALHEMGHALGLAHENRRPETPCHTYGEQLQKEKLAVIGAFDSESIMNKCNYRPATGKRSFRLSQGDVQTLRLLYSRDPSTLEQSLTDCRPGYTFFPDYKKCLISEDGRGGCKSDEVFDDGVGQCVKINSFDSSQTK